MNSDNNKTTENPLIGLIDILLMEDKIKEYYNKLHSWEEANPLELIKQLGKYSQPYTSPPPTDHIDLEAMAEKYANEKCPHLAAVNALVYRAYIDGSKNTANTTAQTTIDKVMALLTDDCDISDTSMFMSHGGNGDYYLTLIQFYKDRRSDFKRLDMRFAMSGGCISSNPEVAKCVWELYRAMEAAGLNKHPKDEV